MKKVLAAPVFCKYSEGMGRLQIRLVFALAAAVLAGAVSPAPTLQQLEQRLDSGDVQRTLELTERFLEAEPEQPDALYIRACALALDGELDASAETLLDAVRAGYRDFTELKRDPNLQAIHEHETYQAIVKAVDDAADDLAEQSLQRWLERFGEEAYTVHRDNERRLIYATSLEPTSHREMRRMLDELADHLAQTLFEGLQDDPVLIAIAAPGHARALFEKRNVGGSYEHRNRRLVSRDTGGSLRHEFFHVLHYGHMERLGQPHALWVQEGLASLYEHYDFDEQGEVTFLANDRDEITSNRARINRLVPWRNILEMDARRFMARATVLYPQARSMFRFVAEQGRLNDWYEAYIRHFDADPTGMKAFEVAFDAALHDVEAQWKQWVKQQPVKRETSIEPGHASLGIGTTHDGASDGILITQILPGSTASAGDLKVGDVLVEIGGRSTTTLNDVRRAINSRAVGDEVAIRVRRNGRYTRLHVRLRALGE